MSDLPGATGPSWTPPPAPGLLPLRPLEFGEILAAPFKLLRRRPLATLGPSLLIEFIVLFVGGGSLAAVVGAGIARAGSASGSARDAIAAGTTASTVLVGLGVALLSIAGSAVLQGMVISAVGDGALGRPLRAARLWRSTRGHRWALIGYVLVIFAICLGLALATTIVVVVAIAVAAAGSASGWAIAGTVALGVAAAIAAVIVGFWLCVRFSLTPSAMVMENTKLGTAMRRSWSLTRRSWWRTFGAFAIVVVVCEIAAQIVQAPFSVIIGFGGGLLFPTGTPSDAGVLDPHGLTLTIVGAGLSLLVSLIVGSIAQVLQSAVGAVLYLDQRMRREGLDITLAKYIEEQQTVTVDPFGSV